MPSCARAAARSRPPTSSCPSRAAATCAVCDAKRSPSARASERAGTRRSSRGRCATCRCARSRPSRTRCGSTIANATTSSRSRARASSAGAPFTPALRRFVATLANGPAFLVDARYDVLAWNDAADALFAFSAAGLHENFLVACFLDAAVRARFITWDGVARDMVGVVRDNFARFGDAAFGAFVDDLRTRSPAFARLWDERPLRAVPTHEVCTMLLPWRDGPVDVRLEAFEPLDARGTTLVVLAEVPPPE